VYGVATLRLLFFVGCHGIITVYLGQFQYLFLFNTSRWIDMIAMIMTVATSVLLYGSTEYGRLMTLGTVTTGFLWLSLWGYLVTFSYGVSIFLGGLFKVREA
jgi:hypothetical protein